MPSSRPSHGSRPGHRGLAAAATGLGLAVAALVPVAPAQAEPADHLVISEVYGGGGNGGAAFDRDFVELYNPTDVAVSVSGWSVQYLPASPSDRSRAGVTALSGSIAPGATYLVGLSGGSAGAALPTPDASGGTNMSASNGQVYLQRSTTPLEPLTPAASPDLVDRVGYGSATSFEGAAAAPAGDNGSSVAREDSGIDTDDNARDFEAGTPTPDLPETGGAEPEPAPTTATIAEIQGDGDASPLRGRTVTTAGVVTAVYATGGYDGFYLQTDGTGTGSDATPGRSDAVFVYAPRVDLAGLRIGQQVEVTGEVSEFRGSTQVVPEDAADVRALDGPAAGVTPLATMLPASEEDREEHEGELLAPQGPFTVTDSYGTNQYAEVGLAAGTRPLVQPTEVADAQDEAAIAAVVADNAARAITLDDGASTNFFSAQDTALPYLTAPDGSAYPVRVGAPVTFTEPVVLEFRNGLWKFQPTTQYTADEQPPVTIENTREAAPEDVGGDLTLATFNVLNYFNTTGEDFEAAGGECSYYTDRAGEEITTRRCSPDGPRGAADEADLARQQAKIVTAINALGAGIVSLEEIENSVALGEPDRDDALADLVAALNADAGAGTWDYVRSPAADDLPPVAEQDVIRTAFIYRPALVRPLGASQVLDHPAFDNAREPLAQLFRPTKARGKAKFAVIVNHFKSKGSGVDDGTGQGNANPDRIAQAHALRDFATDFAAEKGTDKVFLTGDFNSYTQEDPLQVLYAAGYTNLESDFGGAAGESTYSFDGRSGSLDHVLASPAALETVTGVDVWNINSVESVAFEYSRFNYNLTQFYAPDAFRSSDHDPELVGLDVDWR